MTIKKLSLALGSAALFPLSPVMANGLPATAAPTGGATDTVTSGDKLPYNLDI